MNYELTKIIIIGNSGEVLTVYSFDELAELLESFDFVEKVIINKIP